MAECCHPLQEELETNQQRENSNAKNDDGEEVVLNNIEFKGKCNHCGEVGHKKAQCPKLKDGKTTTQQDKTKKFTGECNLCGRKGHKKADCWEDPANAGKRPKNYKPKGEVGGSNVDIILANIELFGIECNVDKVKGIVHETDLEIKEI